MSKLARVLTIGAMVAAMNLAGMTAVAQAQTSDEGKDAQRPPTERQVGEAWRKRPATQQQTAADAALQRQLARERFSIPSGTPAQVPDPTRDGEPSGQSGWLVLGFAVTAALALVAGLAVMAARRASRKVRAGQAA
jgi:hypothetical protein